MSIDISSIDISRINVVRNLTIIMTAHSVVMAKKWSSVAVVTNVTMAIIQPILPLIKVLG